MAEMTLAEIEAELARRASSDNNLLTIGLELFHQNPSKMIAESPSVVNKLLELEAKRLEMEAAKPKVDVHNMTSIDLKNMIVDKLMSDYRLYQWIIKRHPDYKTEIDNLFPHIRQAADGGM